MACCAGATGTVLAAKVGFLVDPGEKGAIGDGMLESREDLYGWLGSMLAFPLVDQA
jgi:hypothetical protein